MMVSDWDVRRQDGRWEPAKIKRQGHPTIHHRIIQNNGTTPAGVHTEKDRCNIMSTVGLLGRLVKVRKLSSSSSLSSTKTTTSSSLLSRWLATSAQKRKWNKQPGDASSPRARRGRKVDLLVEKDTMQKISKADEIREKGVNWRPLFFLGVFPILMSGFVVLGREDLRQELEQKGLGRALMDFRNWRTRRALDYERQSRENEAQERKRQQEESVVVEKPAS
jgi:primosomal protein N''